MVKPARPQLLGKSAAAILFAVPVVLLSACSPPGQEPTDHTPSPGATPPIWTGTSGTPTSQARAGTGQSPAANEQTVTLKNAEGADVATAKFAFHSGYVQITVEAQPGSGLAPGFHGLHIHSVGKCEANSKAPDGTGEPGAFLSAGGHFQAPGHTGSHSSGDLTSLNVRADGSALLVTTTDAVTQDEISGGKTALIIHEGADNFANIPTRYQAEGVPGPDAKTKATGDAGNRVACGVIGAP
ncbi:MAG: superoxide dismutase family protein [Mycolicibacterium insubricum]